MSAKRALPEEEKEQAFRPRPAKTRIGDMVRALLQCDAIYLAPFCVNQPIRWDARWGDRYDQLFGLRGEATIGRLLAICAERHQDDEAMGNAELQVLGYALQQQDLPTKARALLNAEGEYKRSQQSPVAPFHDARWWAIYKNLVLLGWPFIVFDKDGRPQPNETTNLSGRLNEDWDFAHKCALFEANP